MGQPPCVIIPRRPAPGAPWITAGRMISNTLAILSLALYLAAAGRLVFALRHARAPRNRTASALAAAAVALHAAVLYRAVFVPGGLDLGFFHALSLAAWVIVALLLALSLTALTL